MVRLLQSVQHEISHCGWSLAIPVAKFLPVRDTPHEVLVWYMCTAFALLLSDAALALRLSQMHGENSFRQSPALLRADCDGEGGLEERCELVLHDLPGGVDGPHAPAAGDDEAPAGKDEHDYGGVLSAVDEAGEHAALEGALDVVMAVEELEVDVLVVEVHVDVTDDVLDLYDAEGRERGV